MPLGAFKAALMGTAGVSAGADVVLLSSQTASGSASLDFTSGITSTYGEYIFKFYNINPALASAAHFTFNGSSDGGSNYNVTKTTTWFYAYHGEDDGGGTLGYHGDYDLAESTDYHNISRAVDDASDGGTSGELHLFNPSSTTYAKHFYSTSQTMNEDNYSLNGYTAGYFNTTSAIDAVSFKFPSDNFDGKIKMWGVK